MLANEGKFVGFWAPRIGDEAARLKWKATRLLLAVYLLNFVWIPCVIAGIRANIPALTVVGALVACVQATGVVLTAYRIRAVNRATSRMLGLRVGAGTGVAPPPRGADAYEAWCRKHGVVPYEAMSGPLTATVCRGILTWKDDDSGGGQKVNGPNAVVMTATASSDDPERVALVELAVPWQSMNDESDPELQDDNEDQDEAEPFTLREYDEALVFGLAGVSRIADIMSRVLLRQEDSRRFARQIQELKLLHNLVANYAGRLADHYDIELERPYVPKSETAPVDVRPLGSSRATHGGATIRLGSPGSPYLTDGEQLCRMLANAIATVLPTGVTVGVRDGDLWYARGPAGEDLGGGGSIPVRDIFDDDNTGSWNERIERVSEMVLRKMKRVADEALGEAWLGVGPEQEPHAEVRDSKLHLWFSEKGEVGFEFEPIEVEV